MSLFKPGQVSEVEILTHPATALRFARLKMPEESKDSVLQLNGQPFKDTELHVTEDDPLASITGAAAPDPNKLKSIIGSETETESDVLRRTIFIGGLPESWDGEKVAKLVLKELRSFAAVTGLDSSSLTNDVIADYRTDEGPHGRFCLLEFSSEQLCPLTLSIPPFKWRTGEQGSNAEPASLVVKQSLTCVRFKDPEHVRIGLPVSGAQTGSAALMSAAGLGTGSIHTKMRLHSKLEKVWEIRAQLNRHLGEKQDRPRSPRRSPRRRSRSPRRESRSRRRSRSRSRSYESRG